MTKGPPNPYEAPNGQEAHNPEERSGLFSFVPPFYLGVVVIWHPVLTYVRYAGASHTWPHHTRLEGLSPGT